MKRTFKLTDIASAASVLLAVSVASAQPGPQAIDAQPLAPGLDQPAPYESDFEAPDNEKIIAGFGTYISEEAELSDAQRQVIGTLIERSKPDTAERQELINASLMTLYPEYEQAVELLAEEDADAAVKQLTKLSKSDNPYLAAHARYYLARAHTMQERYEDAEPHLNWLAEQKHLDKTLYSGEIVFLKGVTQAELLKRADALQTLKDFVVNYPFASERMVIGALHMIDELSYLKDGTLGDVQDRMDYSRRRLDIEKSDKPTQDEQQRIVTILEKLIKEQEEKENQQSGGGGGGQGQQQSQSPGSGPPSGNQNPSSPANQSSAQAGAGRYGSLDRAHRADGEGDWAQAREKEREEVLNAIKARYPDRYRELVEKYYRSLQEGDD